MRLEQLAPNHYRVFNDKSEFVGTVEKQEFISYRIPVGASEPKRVKRFFWKASRRGQGWKNSVDATFKTRKDAAKFVLDQSAKPYHEQSVAWKNQQDGDG